MSFAIIAELPLGTYRAHLGDGQIDRVPSPSRLAAALLCAAAAGPRAVVDSGALQPSAPDLAALHWLEKHPPDGMRLPRVHVNQSDGIAYRIRLLRKTDFARAPQGLSSVAVDGAYAWTWRSPPPPDVCEALESLCPDVSHLGTSETPVRMTVGETEPTHDLDPDADWWNKTSGDIDVTVATQGRVTALLRTYRDANDVPPTRASDRIRVNEEHVRPANPPMGIEQARYRARERPTPSTPWIHVLFASLDGPVSPDGRVSWAVNTHRALISIIGDGAPSILTGSYADGVAQPANRCSIQILGKEEGLLCGLAAETTLALLIPQGIDVTDLAVIAKAWRQLSVVRGSRRQLRLGERGDRPADQFWSPAGNGAHRLWRTVPAAVPEKRQQRGWSLADTVTLSVGMTFRDQLGGPGRGDSWYRGLARAAHDRGVRVHSATRIDDGDLNRFAHKVQPGLVVQPYRALCDLGGIVDDRTILAIGQSRHLGGGLLVPFDVPAGALQ